MIDQRILEKLSPVTMEEAQCRENGCRVDWSFYNEAAAPRVYASRLLTPGKLISIRPHTRFAYFPPHTHDYVEMIYMCTGATTHIMNGEELILREGELLLQYFYSSSPSSSVSEICSNSSEKVE